MQITFKTVLKRQFTLEANPTDTIKVLKQSVEDATEYSAVGMKLIYGGKELADDQSIESANVQSNVAVIVVAKKKQIAASIAKKKEEETPQTTEQPSSETVPTTTATTTPSTTSATTTTTTTPSTTQPTTTTTTPSEQIPGGPGSTEYDETVQQFLEMGYDRGDIDECMKASFYDRATAAEFLISGIPENVKQMMQDNGGNLPTPPQGGGSLASALAGNQQGFSLRDLFTLSPQLNNLRNAIRQNPTLLREFLTHVSQVSPELYQIIQSNPREFLEIINETGPVSTTGQQLPPVGGELPPVSGEEGAQQQPPPGTILISQEDERKINELVGLGFTKNEAIQAYLACDKNQEMAANLLFENRDRGFEDDSDDEQGMHDE